MLNNKIDKSSFCDKVKYSQIKFKYKKDTRISFLFNFIILYRLIWPKTCNFLLKFFIFYFLELF